MKCAHCGLAITPNSAIFRDNQAFCCTGCAGVYSLINENNLSEFYDIAKSINKVSKKQNPNINNFEITEKNGTFLLEFLISNLSCAACVWLIEKLLMRKEFVLNISINYASREAFVEFGASDKIDAKNKAQEILNEINNFGYEILSTDESVKIAKEKNTQLYAKLIIAIACLMNIMWLSVARYAGIFSQMEQSERDILNFAEFILATPILFFSANSMLKNAINGLKIRTINMDFLIYFGASLIYIYSIVAMFKRLEFVYFDSAAMVLGFVFFGRFLSERANKNALEKSQFFSNLLSKSARLLSGESILASELKKGDIVLYNKGETVLVDGILLESASFDLSAQNGESTPANLAKGDEILSSSVVLGASAKIKCSKSLKESYIFKITQLLKDTKKSHIQEISDAISGYFCLAVLLLAALCFALNSGDFLQAITKSASVLIIACPCALALAAPIAQIIAINKAMGFGVLIKNSKSIENLAKINCVVFDKTGVLTSVKLANFTSLNSLANDELAALFSMLNQNSHPLALSLKKELEKQDFHLECQHFEGLGMSCEVGGKKYFLGSLKFLAKMGVKVDEKEQNFSEMYFANESEVRMKFEFSQELGKGAQKLVKFLKKQKIAINIVSGDKVEMVKKCAKMLKIDKFFAECLPEMKLKILKNLDKNHRILMLGDGINDALALKHASISVSLKNASELAKNTSDIILLSEDLATLQKAMRLANKCYRVIISSLVISFLYNIIFLPLAFFGLLNPMISAIAMSLSSLCVIANSARLNYFKA